MAQLNDSTAPIKGALGDALLELMASKPLQKISASEIARHAGLGRVTYFRHFSSKEEVLAYKYRAAWQDFAARHWYDQEDDRSNAIALSRFCLQVRSINDTIYGAGLESILLRVVLEVFDGEGSADRATTADASPVSARRAQYLRRFKTYGLFGFIDTWIRGGYQESPEEVAAEYVFCLNPEIESLGTRGGGRRTGGRAARMRRLQRIREAKAMRTPHPHIIN
ncbi:TetR/AcrR family transcriptional regulator [Actinomyces sp.]|uniref:TetR/AcrR family transcriptional regulator n=1 Tax=Actinomyces sp. TaxID=29317 RepID=UPI0026DBDED2|nr:TetR/AcrR family transcriptional regulator [Actinomyces sp.]MDO4901093.1 TetR/AcrR family transcriptional regulator [Actinomyces sp.]